MTRVIAHLDAGEELMDTRTFFELYSHLRPKAARKRRRRVPAKPPRIPDIAELGARPLPAAPSPAAAAALEAEIQRAPDQATVARLGVSLARSYASAAALFLVHRDMVQGLCSSGMRDTGHGILFPADAPSFFARAILRNRPLRTEPPESGLDARVLRLLGRDAAREVAVFPVAIQGRVLNLLYADNGPEPLGEAAVAALGAVAGRLSDAYTRLILEQRQRLA